MPRHTRFNGSTCGLILLIGAAAPLWANEVVVQIDSLQPGQQGAIQAGFAENESAAVWLTSPCTGNIVAVQVFWRSVFGNTGQTLGDSITVFNGNSTFPFPGTMLALLEGPVMNDSVLNEFRYLDENQTVPISIPVTAGQVFIVSFRFFDTPNPFVGPSLVTDTNGCQSGKNAINAIGMGWVDACSLGVSGDFVIRAVVDCVEQQGACCLPNGTCQVRTQTNCLNAGGNYRGDGTVCDGPVCDGACCDGNGGCTQTNQIACVNGGGSFRGVAIPCTSGACLGACCLPDGTCLDGQTSNQCIAAGGVYKGHGTTCIGSPCTGACCFNDSTCQQLTLSSCNNQGGQWNGPATNCGTFSCPFRGACCLPDGSCLNNQTAVQCSALGGLYKGNNTNCTSHPCTGACCFGGSCLNLTKNDCQQIGGSVWQGPFYPCASGNLCPTGACCLPLGDCLESQTPAQCAAQSGGVFHNGQTCAQANCPIPVGACCFNGGNSCINSLQPGQCSLIGGSTWLGANTVCAVSCCPPPKGDMNNDGSFNGRDVQIFCDALLRTPTNLEICKGDFTLNGTLTLEDVPGMVAALLALP